MTEQPLNGSDINPLNADPPEDAGEFVERLNISALEYSQSVGEYEEVLLAVEEANSLGEMVVNLVSGWVREGMCPGCSYSSV